VGSIKNAVSSLADFAESRPQFEAAFVQGAAPNETEQKKYVQFSLRPKEPTITGTTANIDVEAVKPGQLEGTVVKWTVEKEGDKWKLKTAPLP
jgi:hypothetical protein